MAIKDPEIRVDPRSSAEKHFSNFQVTWQVVVLS
jgi:hypothetical protein